MDTLTHEPLTSRPIEVFRRRGRFDPIDDRRVRAAVAAGVPTVGVPLMVSLEGAGADALWPTLEDRTPSDIAAFWSAHAASRH